MLKVIISIKANILIKMFGKVSEFLENSENLNTRINFIFLVYYKSFLLWNNRKEGKKNESTPQTTYIELGEDYETFSQFYRSHGCPNTFNVIIRGMSGIHFHQSD